MGHRSGDQWLNHASYVAIGNGLTCDKWGCALCKTIQMKNKVWGLPKDRTDRSSHSSPRFYTKEKEMRVHTKTFT